MGMWEFFRKKSNDKKIDSDAQNSKDRSVSEQAKQQEKSNFSNGNSVNQFNVFKKPLEEPIEKQQALTEHPSISEKNNNPYFFYNIPTPEQLDSIELKNTIDVSKLILTSSIPDHRLSSIILSNIFLIPKNMKGYEDSWPVYQQNLESNKDIRLKLLEKTTKEFLQNIKGKRKRIKNRYFELINKKRDLINDYYEEYNKVLTGTIQNIRVDILPIEKEITEAKYKLNEIKQKISLVRASELEKIKEYHQLLDSNIKSLTKIKDAIKNILSLKKLWRAAHIVASYVVAFFGATEVVRTEEFKEMIKYKLAKLSFLSSSISDFINTNFTIVQGISAALIFLITVGMYDKFVIDYLKRRAIKNEIKELENREKQYSEQLDEIEQKISTLKEQRVSRIKSEISKAESELELLYDDFKDKSLEIDKQISELLKS